MMRVDATVSHNQCYWQHDCSNRRAKRMALLWYVAAILIWWLAGGIVGALGPYNSFVSWFHDFEFAAALTAVFFAGWWLPYTSWLALGEPLFFRIYPDRKAPFIVFALVSFVAYSTVALHYPNWSSAPALLIGPAAAVTVTYLVRRIARRVRAVTG